ncbi:MAG: sigma-70 family RNA polymerase sigma factor [Bifidobacteriaceae bacterium]|jgi:RNA polymerase sigma-70 factor (ECF subfamily)|nr:sigma-70 family RNA polymerase sigma factor [Bifidobacteriaceae bacterium]
MSSSMADTLGQVAARGLEDRSRAQRRERQFAELFQLHHGRVEGYLLRRVQDRERAQDLAAEVFRVAWTRALEGGVPSPPWLFATARNLLANAWRAEGRAARLEAALATELSRDPNPAMPPQQLADLREHVYAGLNELPQRQRELLMARYWDGLTGAECAALIGCPPAAVWMRLSRARAAFKAVYTRLEHET